MPPNGIIDPEALKRVEQSYRERLARAPEDMEARMGLVWCLFVHSLHQAGRENVLTSLASMEAASNPELAEEVRTHIAPGASDLLNDCLRQATTVSHLSSNRQHAADVEKLQTLVQLFGGADAVSRAEEDAARTLADIAREIMHQAGLPLAWQPDSDSNLVH